MTLKIDFENQILALFDSYFWPLNKSHEKINAVFLIRVTMASIWNVFIKFPWQDEKLTKVTEQCFQDGHLSFVGTTAWIYKHPGSETLDPNNWIEFETRRVTEGTNPPGSEWTMVTLPTKRKKGDFYAFRDLVTVPEDLEPGQYVLSFRWDCEHTAQVWSSCANINVV